jgi:esterase/lipase superfamily enzyme
MSLFMICNRKRTSDKSFGDELDDVGTYVCASEKSATDPSAWDGVAPTEFVSQLRSVADGFPAIAEEHHEDQRHICLFVHGYNNSWKDSIKRYLSIRKKLFAGSNGLGNLVLLAWPSNGSVTGYLPDRSDAEASAPGLAEMLVRLHDHLITMQRLAARTRDPSKLCKAKISIIAHSMGNYVVQKALSAAARRLNSPQLVTLINQLVMVAADVDNDIFQDDKPQDGDGSLMANLCYRIGALFSGTDQVLGASAGLKHFGTRRMGRSGLAARDTVWDNVFDLDVTPYLTQAAVANNAHSAVFESQKALELVARILRGVDRKLLPAPN